MSDIHNPHDKFFKETFSYKEVVIDFVKHYLPEEILAIIDVTTIKLLKDSFIQKDLTEFYSDLLFSVSFGERKGFLYFLFEHKSYPEKTIAFQLLRYMLEIWHQELQKDNVEVLPVILPIVIYQGKRNWYSMKTVMDWLGGSGEIDLSLRSFVPHFEFLFYDFSEDSDIEIKGSTKLKAYLQIMKHIYSDNLEWLYSIIIQLDEEKEINYFETVVTYVLNVKDSISLETLKERLTLEGRKKLMTIAEKLRQEGREEGREEGKKEVARKMLIKNIDELEIMELTGLTKDEIEVLKRQIIMNGN